MGDKIAIITIGTEIMQGLTLDTNSYYLSKKLFDNGYLVHTHISISDKEADIVKIIENIKVDHNIIITTGGLGPTSDDMTRESISIACNVDMEVDSRSFSVAKEKHSIENAKKISSYPKGAIIIKPLVGTAGGFILRQDKTACIALPGVPSETKVMFEKKVMPFIKKHYKLKTYAKRHVYRIYDLNEVQVEKKLSSIAPGFNYGLLPKPGEVCLYVTVSGESEKKSEEKLLKIDKEIKTILSKNMFSAGDKPLEELIIKELKIRKLSISVAESSTGGLLGSRLASVGGASSVFLGGHITYAYSEKEKLGVKRSMLLENGAVSEPVATSMAVRSRKKTGSDIAVSITGIAGPEGETKEKLIGLHYIGIADKNDEPIVKKYIFRGDRNQVRYQATQKALLLIKEILKWKI